MRRTNVPSMLLRLDAMTGESASAQEAQMEISLGGSKPPFIIPGSRTGKVIYPPPAAQMVFKSELSVKEIK